MKGKGILIDNNWDLQLVPLRDTNGMIVKGVQVGNTTYQNQAVILTVHPGELKQDPATGIGISDIALDEDLLAWKHRIREQLEREGLIVGPIEFAGNNLKMDNRYDR